MAAGNRHLGYKEVLNALEDRSPGTKAAFLFGFLERGHERFAGDAERRARRAAAVRACAARRRPATSARSARSACAGGAIVPVELRRRVGGRGAARSRAGDRVLLVDAKRRRHLDHPRRRRRVPHPRRRARARRRSSASPRASTVRTTHGRAPRRGAADARRVRARDATRRAGDLSEGPRADPHPRRRLPRRAGARVGRRVRRAHARAAARGRADRARHRLRDPRRLRPPRAAQRRGLPRPRRRRSPSRCATSTTASSVDDLDRILLDLPEPWRVVKHAEQALHPGGILLAYLPTIGQVSRLREELAGSPFGMVETLEVLQRTWHVDGQSVRPDHRMVAHTGFLTHARLLAPGGVNFLDLVVARGRRGRWLDRVPDGVRAARHVVGRPRGRRSSSASCSSPDVADALRGSPPAHAAARRRSRSCVVVATSRRRSAPRSAARSSHGASGRARGALHQGDRVAGAVRRRRRRARARCGCSSPRWRARRAGRHARCATACRGARHRPHRRPTRRRSRRRSAAWSATRRSPRCSTRSRHPTPGRRPADGIPAEVAQRVYAARSCRSRARRAIASRRAPDSSPARHSSSRTRTSSRGSSSTHVVTVRRPSARRRRRRVRPQPRPRGAAVSRPRRCRRSPRRGPRRRRRLAVRSPGRGSALREAPMRIAEQIVARGTDIDHTAATRPRSVRPRRRHRTRRLRRPRRRRRPARSSASSSPSTSAAPPPPTPSPRTELERSPRPRAVHPAPQSSLHRPLPLRMRSGEQRPGEARVTPSVTRASAPRAALQEAPQPRRTCRPGAGMRSSPKSDSEANLTPP